jgi:hypothetical protein
MVIGGGISGWDMGDWEIGYGVGEWKDGGANARLWRNQWEGNAEWFKEMGGC